MRLPLWLALLLFPCPSVAWDTVPHQKITRAALETLPKSILNPLGAEALPLVEIYCLYPDRFLEMTEFGFVRNSPGPRTAAEIRPYCVRPDGQPVHGATGDRDQDTASLLFLFERIASNFARNRPAEAAKYAGVLSHFIADSLSPPHAVAPEELLELAGGSSVHSALERSLPEFSLHGRAPLRADAHLRPAAAAVLDRCYTGAGRNRKDLPSMITALRQQDEPALDAFRLRAGTLAAEILADAFLTAFGTERQSGPQ